MSRLDDYYYNEETNDLVCTCDECPHNENNQEDGWWIDDIQKEGGRDE